jgi:hypothetical protein
MDAKGLKFDFTRVGRTWNRDLLNTMTKASRAQLVLQRNVPADATDDEIDALLDKQERALADLEALSDEQAALLAKVLEEVPTGWLVEDAPTEIDWSKVENLDYIQADRYAEIFDRLRTRNVAHDEAKNSVGHTRSQAKRRGR